VHFLSSRSNSGMLMSDSSYSIMIKNCQRSVVALLWLIRNTIRKGVLPPKSPYTHFQEVARGKVICEIFIFSIGAIMNSPPTYQ
jgi:hypothetical protein